MLIELMDILIWPIVVIIIGCLFRKNIGKLISKIKGIEYSQGNFKVFFEDSLKEVKTTLELPETTKTLPYVSDPKASILGAWIDLEEAAKKKLAELHALPDKATFKNTELAYLESKGTFPPKIESSIQSMRMLRNQIVHYSSEDISEKDAQDYIRIIGEIKKFIDGIHGLPAVQLNAITMIMYELAHLIDSGKHTNITINEIHGYIEDETILDFIANLEGANNLKGILGSELWKGFDRFYIKSLKSIYYGYAGDERRRWGIENSGLCLLLAWTIEIIKMGAGWHPDENLSEL